MLSCARALCAVLKSHRVHVAVRTRSLIDDELAAWDKYSTCSATASALVSDGTGADAAGVTVSNSFGFAAAGVVTIPNLLVQGRIGERYLLAFTCSLGDVEYVVSLHVVGGLGWLAVCSGCGDTQLVD